MIDGIKYERIRGAEYEMLLFEEREISSYLGRMLDVSRSIYDAIEFESETERNFAQALDLRPDVKLFVEAPSWFTIPTPIGTYNPDWAIVMQKNNKIYLVREAKSTTRKTRIARS